MSLTSKQEYQLRKFIKNLEQFRGRHTELVSVYIPAGYDINKVTTHLSQEQGTATNIKSATTRKNVISALEKMIQHLKLFPQTPEHGLAAFAGNVSEREGQEDFQVWSIEPPVPLNTRIYRCDKTFVLDLLQEMLSIKEAYGMVAMDRREADIALLKGKTIIPLTHAKSNVPGKTRAGGQSAARYMRLREDAAKDFYKKVASMMKDQFLDMKDLKGIIVGGPGPTKYEFAEGGFITNEVKKKIIGIKDLSYTGQFGLEELLEKSEDLLASEDVVAEKKIMQEFFNKLAKSEGSVSYGIDQVMKVLKMGAVDKLLLSTTLDEKKIDEFENEANQVGTEVIIVSTDTREGAQLKDMGKAAAILRYEMN